LALHPSGLFINLEFGILNLEFVSLIVYNIIDKEVLTIVNETKPAEDILVKFEDNNLRCRVYI